MGVTWLLPHSYAVSSMYNHTEAVDCPIQVGAWGDMGKHHQDMAFLLIAPSLAIGCEWVFGLTSVWTHPHKVCLPTLEEVAQKLLLLADEGTNWPYAYVRMNDTMAYSLLSSVGYISTLTSGLPIQNACSCQHQLQVWWLLQCRSWVVCPERMNGGLEPLLFNLKELPLWSMADADEVTWDLPMMDVDLSNTVHEASASTRAEDPLGLSFRGALEELQWASPVAPPTLPHNTSSLGHKCLQQHWELLPWQGKQSTLPGLSEQSLIPPIQW